VPGGIGANGWWVLHVGLILLRSTELALAAVMLSSGLGR
jgi:hypothetical protein